MRMQWRLFGDSFYKATYYLFSVLRAEYGTQTDIQTYFWSTGNPNGVGLCRKQSICQTGGNFEIGAIGGARSSWNLPTHIEWASHIKNDAQTNESAQKVISTDPPYYDNIGYADLSDFFYVWLRRSLRPIFPDLFATLAVPKAEELVAYALRHGSKEKAKKFFLDGMTRAMHNLAEQAHRHFR